MTDDSARKAIRSHARTRSLFTPSPSSSLSRARRSVAATLVDMSPSSPLTPEAAASSRWVRTFGSAFTLGRSRRCDLVIPTIEETKTVSKTHARIFPMPVSENVNVNTRQWLVQDLNTLNGTALNGQELLPGGVMELHEGDDVVLSSTMRCGVRLRVHFPSSATAHAPRIVVHIRLSKPETERSPSPSSRSSPSISSIHRTLDNNEDEDQEATDAARRYSVLHKRNQSTDLPSEHATKRQALRQSLADSTTTSAAVSIQRADRLMLCPICLDYFHDSATLPCSHTFCGFCISRWFRASTTISCPECRTPVLAMPVRNRALDALVDGLIGDSDAFRAAVRKRQVALEVATASTAIAFSSLDLRTHPHIYSRWGPHTADRFRSFLKTQFGEHRLSACQQIGLSDAAIQGADNSDLLIATANVLTVIADLRPAADVAMRLRIFLHYG